MMFISSVFSFPVSNPLIISKGNPGDISGLSEIAAVKTIASGKSSPSNAERAAVANKKHPMRKRKSSVSKKKLWKMSEELNNNGIT